MIWGKFTFHFHSVRNNFGHLMIVLFSLIICSVSFGQLNLTVNDVLVPQTTTVTLPGEDILSLRITVYDADYGDEGQLFVNDQGPINLFPGGDSGSNNVSRTINLNLNNTQRGWFNAGVNNLRFTFVQVNAAYDGYRIDAVTPIISIAEKLYKEIDPVLDQEITENRTKALEIYKRLAGISTPIDNPILVQMEDLIDANNMIGAARLATQEASFYNLVVRDFAARMSTREETINTQFNDFTATFIGVVRDNIDARQLLTGDVFYMGSPDVAVASDLVVDVLGSNNHYAQLESNNYDFASVLEAIPNQMIRTPGNGTTEHPDAAGVLTSRAFMGAHAVAGTNRRLVEYTMKQFTCVNMEEWADATAPDSRIGRDIDRFPGGEGSKFLTTCKACHSNMDGFRGAFARYDFSDNFVKYSPFYGNSGGADGMSQNPIGVSSKMNANDQTYSSGYRTTDNTWINNARSPANVQRFGWRGVTSSGVGVKQFATAVANSKAFSKCMVKKVYREVCRRPVANFEQGMVDSVATSFESGGYKLKSLFETIAVRPECLGVR